MLHRGTDKRSMEKSILMGVIKNVLLVLILCTFVFLTGEPVDASGWWLKIPVIVALYGEFKALQWVSPELFEHPDEIEEDY